MLFDKQHHHQCHGSGCGGDHAWTTTGNGDDNRDAERSVEANFWVDASDNGEGDGLGNEGQRYNEPREKVAADV